MNNYIFTISLLLLSSFSTSWATPMLTTDCDNVVISTEDGKIILSALEADVVEIQVFDQDNNYANSFTCFKENCNLPTQEIEVGAGNYAVKIKYYDQFAGGALTLNCERNETVQVLAAPVLATNFRATLSGTQELNAALTSAYGQVSATLDGNVLTIGGSFGNLRGAVDLNIAGGAHVHRGLAGTNGGIELFLTPDLAPDQKSGFFQEAENTFTLSPEQITALYDRSLYFNIHTTAFPGGELRGQLLPEADYYFHTKLLGSNSLPARNTLASGDLVFELNDDQLTVSGSVDNLSDSIAINLAGGAHIHEGYAGQSGGIGFILNLSLDSDQKGAKVEASNNTFTLSSGQRQRLMMEAYYVNIHTKAFLPGEVRGQIAPIAAATFRAGMTGVQQVPAIDTDASGRFLINYHGNNTISVSGSFSNLSSPLNTALAGGIHLHDGAAGRNGGIAFLLEPTLASNSLSAVLLPENNTFELSVEQMERLFNRGNYINIHSLDFPPGELRGQVLPIAKSYFGTNLSGLNSSTPNQSPAVGDLQLELTDNHLVITGGFSGLTGALDLNIAGGAHVHYGAADANGPIALLLAVALDADALGGVLMPHNNSFMISDGLRDSLMAGLLYTNFHSTTFPPGEIRGQLLRDDNAFPEGDFATTAPSNNTVVAAVPGNTFTATWEATSDLNNDLLVYTWQLATDDSFSDLVFTEKLGTTQTISIDGTSLDALLDDLGLAPEASVNLFHRVLASDGSVSSANSFSNTIFKRGEVFNDNPCDNIVITPTSDGFELSNLFADFAHIQIFDLDNNYAKFFDCIGADCILPIQTVVAPAGNYRFNIKLYEQGPFGNLDLICNYKETMVISAFNSSNTNAINYQANLDLSANSLQGTKLNVYPNPTTDQLTIELPRDRTELSQVMIYNQYGQLMFQQNGISAVEQNISLTLEQYTPGRYVVRLQNGKDTMTSSFVVMTP